MRKKAAGCELSVQHVAQHKICRKRAGKRFRLTAIDSCSIVRLGYAYYGEYPLAFAACFGYADIYDYLIRQGANPNYQDSFGNNVLHMMVIANQTV